MTNSKTAREGNTRFVKKGKAGPGRPRVSPEQKKLTRLTKTRFNTAVRKYLHLNKAELKKVALDKDTPALDLMIISVMNKAITAGDEKRLNWFLEQLFGKLKEKTEIKVSGKLDTNAIDVKKLSTEELQNLLELVKKCEDEPEQD